MKPTQREDLLRQIAEIDQQRAHFAASYDVVDKFIAQQRASIPTLIEAQGSTDLSMHEALAELGTTVADVASIIGKATIIRNRFHNKYVFLQEQANQLRERVV